VILTLLLLAACFPEPEVPPYGIWVSEEPNITLFIKPEYRIPERNYSYFGVYAADGDYTKTLVRFGTGRHFTIYDLTEPRTMGGGA